MTKLLLLVIAASASANSSAITLPAKVLPVKGNAAKKTVKRCRSHAKVGQVKVQTIKTAMTQTVGKIPTKTQGLDMSMKLNLAFVKDFDTIRYRNGTYSIRHLAAIDAVPNVQAAINNLAAQGASAVYVDTIPNDPSAFVEPRIEFKIGGKINEEFIRGAAGIKARLEHNQDDNHRQFKPEFGISQAYAQLGRKHDMRIEFGLCDSPAQTVFTSDSQFFRGSDKGVFGVAAGKFIKANEFKKGQKLVALESTGEETMSFQDSHKMTEPGSRFFFQDKIVGDDCENQPRVNIYSPIIGDRKYELQAGVGATLTTNAQNGIFVTVAGNLDYKINKLSRVRLSAAGGISAKSEDKLGYERPMGIALGAAYLSKAIDVAVKGTYSGKSCVLKNRLSGYKSVLLNESNIESFVRSSEGELQAAPEFTYDKSEASAPWTVSLRTRIDLGNDKDLTLGAIFSRRNTGIKDSVQKVYHESAYGLSIGFNMPLANVPFRAGVEASYMRLDNPVAAHENAFLPQLALPFVPNRIQAYKLYTSQVFTLTFGLNYAPVIDEDDDHHKPVGPFVQKKEPHSIV